MACRSLCFDLPSDGQHHLLMINNQVDSHDDFRSSCRNASQCHQQFFSELHSPGQTTDTPWVQTIYFVTFTLPPLPCLPCQGKGYTTFSTPRLSFVEMEQLCFRLFWLLNHCVDLLLIKAFNSFGRYLRWNEMPIQPGLQSAERPGDLSVP